MESTFWERVVADGHRVPDDADLTEMTTELTTMLGAVDPAERDGIAYSTLAAWVGAGVYDDLLQGLGDGMASGLSVGLGRTEDDTVFRRAFSVLVLAKCIERDNTAHLLPPDTVLRWGDRVVGWYLRERDLRGFVPGKGWAHAVAHGADALGALAGSAAVGRMELTVVLDVLADRLLSADQRLVHGETDRLAAATMSVLRRDLVGLDLLEPWVARLADQATPAPRAEGRPAAGPEPVRDNAQAFLRSLYLQLALGRRPPACRTDLLLVVIAQLQRANTDALD